MGKIKAGYGRTEGDKFQRWVAANIASKWALSPPQNQQPYPWWIALECGGVKFNKFDDIALFQDDSYYFYQVKHSSDVRGGDISELNLLDQTDSLSFDKLYASYLYIKGRIQSDKKKFELIVYFNGTFTGTLRSCLIRNVGNLQKSFCSGKGLKDEKKILRDKLFALCRQSSDFKDFLLHLHFIHPAKDPESEIKELLPELAQWLYNIMDYSTQDATFRIYNRTVSNVMQRNFDSFLTEQLSQNRLIDKKELILWVLCLGLDNSGKSLEIFFEEYLGISIPFGIEKLKNIALENRYNQIFNTIALQLSTKNHTDQRLNDLLEVITIIIHLIFDWDLLQKIQFFYTFLEMGPKYLPSKISIDEIKASLGQTLNNFGNIMKYLQNAIGLFLEKNKLPKLKQEIQEPEKDVVHEQEIFKCFYKDLQELENDIKKRVDILFDSLTSKDLIGNETHLEFLENIIEKYRIHPINIKESERVVDKDKDPILLKFPIEGNSIGLLKYCWRLEREEFLIQYVEAVLGEGEIIFILPVGLDSKQKQIALENRIKLNHEIQIPAIIKQIRSLNEQVIVFNKQLREEIRSKLINKKREFEIERKLLSSTGTEGTSQQVIENESNLFKDRNKIIEKIREEIAKESTYQTIGVKIHVQAISEGEKYSIIEEMVTGDDFPRSIILKELTYLSDLFPLVYDAFWRNKGKDYFLSVLQDRLSKEDWGKDLNRIEWHDHPDNLRSRIGDSFHFSEETLQYVWETYVLRSYFFIFKDDEIGLNIKTKVPAVWIQAQKQSQDARKRRDERIAEEKREKEEELERRIQGLTEEVKQLDTHLQEKKKDYKSLQKAHNLITQIDMLKRQKELGFFTLDEVNPIFIRLDMRYKSAVRQGKIKSSEDGVDFGPARRSIRIEGFEESEKMKKKRLGQEHKEASLDPRDRYPRTVRDRDKSKHTR